MTRLAGTCSALSGIAITLMLGCGGSSSKTTTTPPTITSFTPLTGMCDTAVTVTGTGFLTTSAVSVGGVATNPGNIISDNQLTFLVPTTAVSGYIAVSNAGGTATTSVPFTVAPSFVSAGSGLIPLSPTSGAVLTKVTINGYGFASNATVTFGASQPVPATVQSANTLTVDVPNDATTGAVVVTVGSLAATGPTFTVN